MQVAETIYNRKPLQRLNSEYVSTEISLIKKLIWLYFLLLLFEGALRKWFLPSLSQGLLIIRDPVVIWIYYIAYNKDNALKTGLPFVMHQADIMAARFENERWMKIKQGEVTTKNVGGIPTKKAKLENVKMPEKIDFKSIFGEVEEA